MGSNEGDGEMKMAAGTLKKGPWTAAEDAMLVEYVEKHGEGNWNAVRRNSGLARCGKSCRLRWANHLRPNLKKCSFSPEEERLILELHAKLGNKWARMAAQLPGRTDNEIKNYWNTRVKRRLRQGLALYPQDIQTRTSSSYCHRHNNITQTQNLLPASSSSTSPMLSPHRQSSNSPHNSLSLFNVNSHNSSAHFITPHTPPPLYSSSNRYKRYRSPNVDFSLNPSSSNPQLSSPLGHYVPSQLGQSMFTQLPHVSPFSLGSELLNQNSLQKFQTQFKSDNGYVLSTGGFSFLVKPELPSSQIYQTTMQYDTSTDNDMKRSTNGASRHGSGLLDDLLRESETISSNVETRGRGSLGSEQEKGALEGLLGHWDDSSSLPSSSEAAEQMNLMHEDLSSILNSMPPTMKLPLWYTNSDELSNGHQLIVETDVQQLTASLPITASTAWDNMPGIR